MKKYWKVIGMAAMVAGALYYPAMKLYKYMIKRSSEGNDGDVRIKAFIPAFRGKHKPHHHNSHNGHTSATPGDANLA